MLRSIFYTPILHAYFLISHLFSFYIALYYSLFIIILSFALYYYYYIIKTTHRIAKYLNIDTCIHMIHTHSITKVIRFIRSLLLSLFIIIIRIIKTLFRFILLLHFYIYRERERERERQRCTWMRPTSSERGMARSSRSERRGTCVFVLCENARARCRASERARARALARVCPMHQS